MAASPKFHVKVTGAVPPAGSVLLNTSAPVSMPSIVTGAALNNIPAGSTSSITRLRAVPKGEVIVSV